MPKSPLCPSLLQFIASSCLTLYWHRGIVKIQQAHQKALSMLNNGIPKNDKVVITRKKQKGWITLTPLEAQQEPANIEKLKAEITQQWPMTSLLDILKEGK